MLRSQGKATISKAPSSVAFCTTCSSLSALGKPMYTLTRSCGSLSLGNSASTLRRTSPGSSARTVVLASRPAPSQRLTSSPGIRRSTLAWAALSPVRVTKSPSSAAGGTKKRGKKIPPGSSLQRLSCPPPGGQSYHVLYQTRPSFATKNAGKSTVSRGGNFPPGHFFEKSS